MRHTQTDPACVKHREPRTRFGLWLFNRARGRGCVVCTRSDELRLGRTMSVAGEVRTMTMLDEDDNLLPEGVIDVTMRVMHADSELVAAAGKRQSARWRATLDRLADN